MERAFLLHLFLLQIRISDEEENRGDIGHCIVNTAEWSSHTHQVDRTADIAVHQRHQPIHKITIKKEEQIEAISTSL